MTSVINDVIFLLKNIIHHFNYSPQNNIIFFYSADIIQAKKNKVGDALQNIGACVYDTPEELIEKYNEFYELEFQNFVNSKEKNISSLLQ